MAQPPAAQAGSALPGHVSYFHSRFPMALFCRFKISYIIHGILPYTTICNLLLFFQHCFEMILSKRTCRSLQQFSMKELVHFVTEIQLKSLPPRPPEATDYSCSPWSTTLQAARVHTCCAFVPELHRDTHPNGERLGHGVCAPLHDGWHHPASYTCSLQCLPNYRMLDPFEGLWCLAFLFWEAQIAADPRSLSFLSLGNKGSSPRTIQPPCS